MNEATQETDTTNEHPHRRLNVVPKRICTDCIHHKRGWDKGNYYDACKAGDVVTSTVNGDKTYVTKCADKNADGECQAYVAIDHEAIAKEEKADNLRIVLTILLTVAGFIGLMVLLIVFGSPSK